MLCDKDDFLLIVEQWLTESASVLLMLELFDEPESPFLGLMLRGVIASIDHTYLDFLLGAGETIVRSRTWLFIWTTGKLAMLIGASLRKCLIK